MTQPRPQQQQEQRPADQQNNVLAEQTPSEGGTGTHSNPQQTLYEYEAQIPIYALSFSNRVFLDQNRD